MGLLNYLSFFGQGPSGAASVSGIGGGSMGIFGGTPASGLVLGGTFRVESNRDDFHGAPASPEGYATVRVIAFAAMIDWYPSPMQGWHVGALLGPAVLSVMDSLIPDSNGVAVASSIMGGYDWWIGPQWSLGLLLVGSATTATSMRDSDNEDTGYRFQALSVGLEWSLLLH